MCKHKSSGRTDTATRGRLAAGLLVLGLGLVAVPLSAGAVPIRLTDYAGNDMRPTWDPSGSDTIAYQTNNGASATNIFNLGGVQANDTNERLLATGPNSVFGIAAQNVGSWAGTTGRVIVAEQVVFHEYMSFMPQATTFNRTVADGNDAAFTRELLIPGGGGGGFLLVSRDGTSAVWRWSTSGGSGTEEVRTGSFASLVGQNANATGTVIASLTSANQYFLQGAAIAPDGSTVILAEPSGAGYDLFLYNFNGTGRTALTTSGLSSGFNNLTPDFTPDGTHIAFARTAPGGNYDLWMMGLDGSDLTQLTATSDRSELWPTWAPDGERFAYGRFDPGVTGGGDYNIYVDRITVGPPPSVPEPGSLALVAAAVLGLALSRKARQP